MQRVGRQQEASVCAYKGGYWLHIDLGLVCEGAARLDWRECLLVVVTRRLHVRISPFL